MTDQRLLAARALFAKLLAEEVDREVRRAREALEPTLVPGEKVKALLPDGRVVGTVQLTERVTSVVVVDEAALLAYVRRARPDQIITSEAIRPSFLSWLRNDAKKQLQDEDSDGQVVDANGEIVPGLQLMHGSAAYRPVIPSAGKKVLRDLMADLLGGELHTLLALPGETE